MFNSILPVHPENATQEELNELRQEYLEKSNRHDVISKYLENNLSRLTDALKSLKLDFSYRRLHFSFHDAGTQRQYKKLGKKPVYSFSDNEYDSKIRPHLSKILESIACISITGLPEHPDRAELKIWFCELFEIDGQLVEHVSIRLKKQD